MGVPELNDDAWFFVHARQLDRPPAEIRSLTAAFCPVSGGDRFEGSSRALSAQ
jgi:hypothetical protein